MLPPIGARGNRCGLVFSSSDAIPPTACSGVRRISSDHARAFVSRGKRHAGRAITQANRSIDAGRTVGQSRVGLTPIFESHDSLPKSQRI
ncbi:hypothetical protein GSH10_14805 [Burkholderia pseudomallei]|nr:hypothetical protein T210_0103605 [Burkholderia pseudomallei MSHR6137]MBM5591846.1 hypothetical protein [Burkholderia pseudomallei]